MTTHLTSFTYPPFYFSYVVPWNLSNIIRFTNPTIPTGTTNFTTTTESGAAYHSRKYYGTTFLYKSYNFSKPNSTAFLNVYREMKFVEVLLHRKFDVYIYDSDAFIDPDTLEKTWMGNINNLPWPNMFRLLIVAEEFRNKTFEEVGVICPRSCSIFIIFYVYIQRSISSIKIY